MLKEPGAARRAHLNARRHAIAQLRRMVLAGMSRKDVRVRRRFSIASGFRATVTAAGLQRLLADPDVLRIDPHLYGSAALAQTVPQIRADAVHRRDDFGQGVTVAVLDTGVDPTHPDLTGAVIDEHCFCTGGCCPNGTDEQSGPGSAFTRAVHGTHVMGIIASQGIVAPPGVAPAAKVVAVKVLDDGNRGDLTDWVAGLEWIALNHPDVQAINMSLVSDAVYPEDCDVASSLNLAFAQVFDVLRARGTLTFVASGNTGQVAQMAAPACVRAAVAVGAVTKSDGVWLFSDADAALDVLAPGVSVVSSGTGHSTKTLSGTSMATAHATGTAALMLAFNPQLGAEELESILERTGKPIADTRNGLTFPRLNALTALQAVLDVSRPLLGGGSRLTDCLVEWNVMPPSAAVLRPVPGVACRDNDPVCDADHTLGQCTFRASACFDVPELRLPGCGADVPIIAYGFVSPRTAPAGDGVDAANARALAAALPGLPIMQRNTCGAVVPFVVPVDSSPATRWIRLYATTADGRMDYDRLRFTCLPAE